MTTVNFLAGSSLNFKNSMFFELFQTNEIYLGYSRPDPLWGFSSLIKINATEDFPTDILGLDDSTPGINDSRYFDRRTFDNNTEVFYDQALTRVFVAYIRKTDDENVFTNYTFLGTDEIGDVYNEYINKLWMRITGLNHLYLKEVTDNINLDEYDLYMFNYNQDLQSRILIEKIEDISLPELKIPVKLMYNTLDGSTAPSTAIGDNIVGNLEKRINIYGESFITGIKNEFLSYVEDNSLTNATWFLTNANGSIIQEGMSFLEVLSTDEEQGLLFSFNIINEAVNKSGRLKITTQTDTNELGIFNEQFSDSIFVSDKMPPPLTLNYLKSTSIHSSIMDLLGMVKIESSEVSFARRIDTQVTLDHLESIQGIDIKEITILDVDGEESTTVSFAYTSDSKLARENFFDLIQINKEVSTNTLDSSVPLDLNGVYRQLFVAFKPKDSNGIVCTEDYYNTTEMFNYSDHSFDFGTILYLANKPPVFRQFLSSSELFTLII